MLHLSVLALLLTGAEPAWHTDYVKATDQAMKEKKDLVIYFRDKGELDDSLKDAEVQKRLEKFVCLKLPVDAAFEGKKLLDYSVLTDMMGNPGLVVVSYHNSKLPTYATVVSVHPYVGSRYRWVPAYGVAQIKVTLDLPASATLTQRSMIFAVRMHPEVPQSVFAVCHPAFLEHAQSHSARQANMGKQHHANLIATSSWLQGRVGTGFGGASEVVAESWGRFVGRENVLEASFTVVDMWRHSSGHWGAVSGRHAYFGYDIAQARDGTWYATGIFAD